MDIIYTNDKWEEQGILSAAKLDCAFGSGENDIELTLNASGGITLEPRSLVYVEGTEYGGVIDKSGAHPNDGTLTYCGRSAHGILLAKVLKPDAGQDYLYANGEANEVLSWLVGRLNLGDLFTVPKVSTGIYISYQFYRYTDAWSGILKMLATSSLRPQIIWTNSTVELSAVPMVQHEALDTDIIDHDYERDWLPINHLVCLGSGELQNRVVIDYYADAKGNVSRTQSLFGIWENAATYDYSGADEAQLVDDGYKKLQDLQDSSSITVDLDSDNDYYLGDIVVSIDSATGTEVSAQITKKTVVITGDRLSISYSVGGSASGESLSGTSESSGGKGVSYVAGEGIKISGQTISAEVTQSELDTLSTKVDESYKSASDASTTAGAAQNSADVATAKADTAQATADSKVAPDDIAAISPITVSVVDGYPTIAHGKLSTTSASYGQASSASPAFGGSVSVPYLSVDTLGHVVSGKTSTVAIPSSVATTSSAGLMSASDKTKLNGMATGANKYTLPTASTSTLGGIKVDGSTISISNGTISVVPRSTSSLSIGDVYPIGSIYQSSKHVNPAITFGVGTWKELPTMEGFKWERTA